MPKVKLQIEGMSCGHCLNAVNKALEGVLDARIVSVQMGRAEIEMATGGPTDDVLVTAIEEAGYSVALVERD